MHTFVRVVKDTKCQNDEVLLIGLVITIDMKKNYLNSLSPYVGPLFMFGVWIEKRKKLIIKSIWMFIPIK